MARRGNRQLLTTLGECQACRWRRPRGWPGRSAVARPPHRIGSPGRRSPYAPHRAADSRSRQVAAVSSNPLRSRVRRFESCWGRINRTKLQNSRTSAHFADLHPRNRAADSAPHTPPTRLAVLPPPQARGRRKQRTAGPYPLPGIAAQLLPAGNCPQPPPAHPATGPDEPQAQSDSSWQRRTRPAYRAA